MHMCCVYALGPAEAPSTCVYLNPILPTPPITILVFLICILVNLLSLYEHLLALLVCISKIKYADVTLFKQCIAYCTQRGEIYNSYSYSYSYKMNLFLVCSYRKNLAMLAC
jgi:hypothetical protein